MKKRLLAGILWFYTAWYAWSVIATLIGVSTAPGPVFGFIAALLLAGDPFGRIWQARTTEPRLAPASPSADPA
jgi:hypothetical protein